MKFPSRYPSWLATSLATLAILAAIPARAAESPDLDLQLVNQRIASLKQQGETADTSATLQAYQETQALLREADKFSQLARQFEAEADAAAQEEADARGRIDEAEANGQALDPAVLARRSWERLNDQASGIRNTLQNLLDQRDSLDQQIAAEAGNAESIRARLNAIDAEQAGLPQSHALFESGGVASQFEASQWRLAAQHQALDAERNALTAQLANQPTRSRLRRAHREKLVRTIETLQENLSLVDQALTGKRPAGTERLLERQEPGTPVYILLEALAKENTALAEERRQRAEELTEADAEKTRADSKLFELMEQFNAARRLVDSGGKASVYGPFLMNYFLRLDQLRPPARKSRMSKGIGEIVIDRARHEQQQAELLESELFIRNKLEELGLDPAVDEKLLKSAKPLLQARHDILAELMASESELVQLIGRIDISYEQLDSLLEEFRAYLIGHILWVRSHLPLSGDFLKQLMIDLRQARDEALASMKFSGRTGALVAILLGLVLLVLRRRMWRRIETLNAHVGRPREDTILWSMETLGLTVLRSAAVPLVMVGLALSIDNYQQGLLQPLAVALLLSSGGVMLALFLRDATASGGMARVHFGWPEERCKAVSSLMTWVLVRLMPVAILASFLVQVERHSPHALLGRLLLCVGAVMIALKLRRMLLRQRETRPARGTPAWLQDGLLFGLTGALVVIILDGFLLPARIIYYSLASTAIALVCLVFLHEMLMRWLLVARRRIRFQQLVAALPESADQEKADTEARQASLGDLSDSTAQLIKSLVYVLGVISVVLIWASLLPAIQGLQRFTLWTVTQTVNGEQLQTHITLATIVLAILVFIGTFYAARRIPALIELIMRSTGHSTPATRYTVSTITNYIIIAIGTMVFFSTLKMSWSQLQWLVAALGVGIGFGLQEIVANFISGLIILFERPIRVGDVVTIGESSGEVTRIQIRATTIRDWDGKELLVPNKEFVTGRLLNWTLSDTTNRITLDVGIAYGSDVGEAMRILNQVVTSNPTVLKDPAPNILFTQFGDSALLLSARCFLADLEDRLRKVSELNQQIYQAFNEAGIVIAFPQLDVHLDPASPLTVRLQKEDAAPTSS